MEKKRVLVLTTAYFPFIGGAEVAVQETVKRLNPEFGFTIFTAQMDRGLPKEEDVDGIKVYRLGIGRKADKYLFPLLAVLKSRNIEFDLVYVIASFYTALAALLIKRLFKRPYIINLQKGAFEDYFTLGRRFSASLTRTFYKKAGAISAISVFLKNQIEKYCKISSGKVVIIPNGVDLDKFAIETNSVTEKKNKEILVVARLEPVKGVEYFIKAAPYILKEYPAAEAVIVGDGSQRERLELLVKELNLSDKIKFLGKVEREKLPGIMSEADVLVCPSLAEGFGIVCVEAMAAGLPVVASNVGGIPDAVKDGENGFLVEPANEKVLAAAVIKIFQDNFLRVRLSENARARARDFSWDKISNLVGNLIRKAAI